MGDGRSSATGRDDQFGELAAGLARILFPLVLILGLTGIVVGILNSYDHFTVPALSPVLWNLIILLGLGLGVQRTSSDSTRLYIYAVAILVATIAQFLLPLPWLRGLDGRLHMVIDIHDPAVKRTFKLMVPVTIGLGLININALIDQLFATHLPATTQTRRAGGDRAGVPALHAPAGGVLGRRGDGALSAPVAPRVAAGLERIPPHDEHRAPADLLPARAGERGGGGARDADRAAPLPARELHGRPTRRSSRPALPHSRWGSRSTGRC